MLLLDHHGVSWRYEPETFVIDRDATGAPTETFTPDLYLPAHDLYLEVTTLRQKLIEKKDRRVRRLRDAHPEVSILLLYQRDVLALLVDAGLAPPDALAGYGPLAPAGDSDATLESLGVLPAAGQAADPPATS